MKEVMMIMGMREWVHQLSWAITGRALFLWIAISFTLYTGATFLPNSNKAILFAIFFTFCQSLVSLSMLVSVFFSNSKLAAICGPVVLIFAIIPKFVFFGTQNTESKYFFIIMIINLFHIHSKSL
jgi:hypothetical protein